MKAMTFTTAKGVPMRVLYLEPGEHGAFPIAISEKPLVEFYDTRYDFTEYGQFTGGRYYAETLLADDRLERGGLDLQGGVPDWTIDDANMVKVMAFLREAATVDA